MSIVSESALFRAPADVSVGWACPVKHLLFSLSLQFCLYRPTRIILRCSRLVPSCLKSLLCLSVCWYFTAVNFGLILAVWLHSDNLFCVLMDKRLTFDLFSWSILVTSTHEGQRWTSSKRTNDNACLLTLCKLIMLVGNDKLIEEKCAKREFLWGNPLNHISKSRSWCKINYTFLR